MLNSFKQLLKRASRRIAFAIATGASVSWD